MDLTLLVSMLGAIALFLFGMSTMTDGLTRFSGGRLEQILEKLSITTYYVIQGKSLLCFATV